MLKGLGGLGDMAKMMKAAQDMQTKMGELQEQMAEMTVDGESGAGLVKVTASLKGELNRWTSIRRSWAATTRKWSRT